MIVKNQINHVKLLIQIVSWEENQKKSWSSKVSGAKTPSYNITCVTWGHSLLPTLEILSLSYVIKLFF